MKTSQTTAEKPAYKRLGLSYLIPAAIFLFLPNINIIDILPDFFGIWLLISALSKLADISPAMRDASDCLVRLRPFLGAKLLFNLLVPMVDDTFVLTFTFLFAIVELIYLLPMVGHISDGLDYLGTRFECRAIYQNRKNVMTLTYVLIIAKRALCVFPELCSLSSFEYSGNVTSGVQTDIAHYKPFLNGLNLIVTTVIGIIWLVNVIPYIKRIISDSDFGERVAAQYKGAVGSNFGLLYARRLRLATNLAFASGFFLIDFRVEEINILPKPIFALLMLAAFFVIRRDMKDSKRAMIVCGVSTLLSGISMLVMFLFARYFVIADVVHYIEAYEFYNITRVVSLLEMAGFAACGWFWYIACKEVISGRLGPDAGDDRHISGITVRYQTELMRRQTASFVLFAVTIAAYIVYLLMRAELYDMFPEDATWYVPAIILGIWQIYNYNTTEALIDQVRFKYSV